MLHLIKSLIRSLGAAGRSAGTTAHGERVAQPAAARRETIALNATAIQEAINDFRALGDDESLDELCARRRELAAFILQTPTTSLPEVWGGSLPEVWSGSLRPLHGLIMHSGVRELPRSADDGKVLEDLRARIVGRQRGEVDAAALLGAFMFAYSHEVPLPANLSDVPGWLRADYAAILLEMPQFFNRPGEADEYLAQLMRSVGLMHDFVSRVKVEPIGGVFQRTANMMQAYFNVANLRGLYATRGEILTCALVAAKRPLLAALPPRPGRQKIRLGIYVRNFMPMTETYFMISHYEHLDRSRFDITLYTRHESGHPLEKRCFAAADRVVVLPEGDLPTLVDRIREADLDVLIIGTNATTTVNNAALLGAHRLARIQVASVSSPITTGMRQMDIMLSAQMNESAADAPAHYTEYLYRMPGSVNCYAYQYDEDPPTIAPTRAAMGIRDTQLVFMSGVNYYKILPELALAWARILAAVPDSVLILMPFSPTWNADYQVQPFIRRIQRQMRELGVSEDRLRFEMPVPNRADVHRILELADVYLDAFPFAGACSMLDPLYVGIPPVAWRGPTSRSSHGAAMLEAMNLPELVAASGEEYERLAIALAGDAPRRSAIRTQLLAGRNGEKLPPYFDTADFSRRVGRALETMYSAYQQYYESQREQPAAQLRASLQVLADGMVGRVPELDGLTDECLARYLVLPFLRDIERNGRSPLILDVGACYGSISHPFVAEGWRAVLFEPDPAARQKLEVSLAPFRAQCTIVSAAAGNSAAAQVAFHKSKTAGLSGFAESPFGATESVITVSCVRLADYCAEQGIAHVDFLKIDAEGYDFEVLEGFDATEPKARLIMVEYGTHFARQSIDIVNQAIGRMQGLGYRAVVFNYDDEGAFASGSWNYRLTDLFVDRLIPAERAHAFGNIIFYAESDVDFLLTLVAFLDFCRPRAEYWSGLLHNA